MPVVRGFTAKERLNPGGGHTDVYRAVRDATGEPVVLKLPRASAGPDEALRVRTEHEILKELEHPGIVRAIDLITDQPVPVLVLGFVPGTTLRERLRAVGRFELSAFFGLAIKLAEVLQVVHARRLIHLDVNPSNVMIDGEDGLRLIDFGISTRVRREHRFSFNPVGLAGTLPYLAPEQTGRTNRSVDYRADLYAFGCTCFEMLVGRPPFEGRDPLELVHHHVARIPPQVDELRPEVPRGVARIIAKLLAKNAEDRYQSAAGVAADLASARDAWHADLTADFALGERDVSSLFAVPETLVGREAEVASLLGRFEAMDPRRAAMVVVRGYSGVGKTRLVREVQRPITARAGYFCSGKFDQFQRHLPFAALRQALGDLVGQVLVEPADRVASWRRRVLDAVDGSGALLVEAVPELAALIGEQPPVAELPPNEARHRFASTLRAFLAVCCDEEHPVAMFLDDLQWVDGATLEWLEETLARPEGASLFLVGAYRDNEVDAAHPLSEAFDRLRARGAPLHDVSVEPLGAAHVRAIVAGTLDRPEAEAAELAAVCFDRTGGNPFFLQQLLETLHDEGAIAFDAARGRWSWDAAAAVAAQASPNVVDLVVARLSRLPEEVRRALFAAACLGNRFDSGTLALAVGRDEAQVIAWMEQAREGGFLVRIKADGDRLTWGFLHDRVQQAAFQLVSDADGSLRRAIGWQMADAVDAGRDDLLFGALQNLNPSRAQEPNRPRLAALNLLAAARARKANAYGPALEHARIATELEGAPSFETTFERAWCEHLGGDDAAAEASFGAAQALATDDAQRARSWEARVHFFTDLARFPEAYAVGREGAAWFGHTMPASFVPPALIADFLAMSWSMWGRDVNALVDHAVMTDQRLLVGARLACAALKAAYQIRPELCVANAIKLVRTCLKHGNFDDAPVAWLVAGSIFQGGVLGRHAVGFDWGRLAIDLIDRFDNAKQRAEVLFVFAYFANSWSRPLIDTEALFRSAWRAGQASGDVFHASCACSGITQNLWMRGAPLDEVVQECDRFAPFLEEAQSRENLGTVRVVRQAARALQGLTRAPWELADDTFDDAAFEAELGSWGSKHFAHFHAVDKLGLAVLAEQWDAAERLVTRSAAHLADSVGMQHRVEHHFYEALVAAERGRASDVRKQARAFTAWAARCPQNYRHKALMLDGELARLQGRTQDALDALDAAAADAAANGFRQHEGLAMLRMARLHRSRGAGRAAARCLSEAIRAFQGWGATALVERLRAETGDLPSTGDTWRTSSAGGTRRMGTTATTQMLHHIDASSLIKASEAMASEVRLARLLERMLEVAAENAGATRAAMLLPDGGSWRVRAERDVGGAPAEPFAGPWQEHPRLAVSVVQLALRTQKPVVVGDLREDERFRGDVRANATRAVMALPLVHQAAIRGVLYLENELTAGGFTADRVTTLEMLVGPMAVSVENASLYEALEDKVRQRTEQLELRNRLIRQTFGRYLSDDVVHTLLESPKGLALGGERQRVTILMSDLRGFVAMSDRLTPEQVVQLLNNYLSQMTRIIFAHRGTIDEFLGDAILVVFGAPFRRDDDEERAVRCAVEMQREMASVNAWNEQQGLPRVEMGIGLHTGDVVVGNIGSEKRAKYGVVGQTVNLASRVESYTVGGQVLVSEETARSVRALKVGARMVVEPKGVRAPITILEVLGVGGGTGHDVPRLDDGLRVLAEPVGVRLRSLEGKDVLGDGVDGRIVALSPTVAVIEGVGAFDPLTNVRLDLTGPDGASLEGIYAKVPMQAAEPGRLRVRFTAVPPAVANAIAAWT